MLEFEAMSPVRRVRIDDQSPQEWDASDLLRDDDEALSPDVYEADERERLLAEDREAERQWTKELHDGEDDEEDGPLRERDLEPPEVAARKPQPSLTEQQRRVQAVRSVPIHTDQRRRGMGPPWKPGDDLRSDETAQWLRERDPDYETRAAASEIAAEVSRRLAGASVARENVRSAFAPGKPTAGRRTTRRALREALCDLYADGARHDLLAAELGCSRQALHALMMKP